MAISNTINLVATALWPQGDARDPLGVWGARQLLTSDASGGSIKVAIQAPATIAGAYVYTAYSAQVSRQAGTTTVAIKCRLLTNWPDVDPIVDGVQGYGSLIVVPALGESVLTAPRSGPSRALVQPNDRFVLLFDPRPVAGAFNIMELEIAENVDANTYSFEAWGYYWDRGVLNAPGGLRHPGST